MSAVLLGLLKTAGLAIFQLIMSAATKEFFQEVFIMLAEMAVKSTKTDWDDKFLESFKNQVESNEENNEK